MFTTMFQGRIRTPAAGRYCTGPGSVLVLYLSTNGRSGTVLFLSELVESADLQLSPNW